MSEQDVEKVRSAYEAYAAGDVSEMRELLHPGCEIQDVPSIPDPEVHRGYDGFIRSQEKFAEIFEGLRLVPEEVIDVNDSILVLARAHGIDKRTGKKLDARVAALWTMQEGRATKGVYYEGWEQALEAAGVSE